MAHDPQRTPNADFPKLTPDNHRVIGPATPGYNCIAWACGDTARWWQPGWGYFWPVPAGEDDCGVGDLVLALGAVGFVECESAVVDPGYETVAIYAHHPFEYTHAARLQPDGKWSSKLGPGALIEHNTAEAVSGGVYGQLVAFLHRPVPAAGGN